MVNGSESPEWGCGDECVVRDAKDVVRGAAFRTWVRVELRSCGQALSAPRHDQLSSFFNCMGVVKRGCGKEVPFLCAKDVQ